MQVVDSRIDLNGDIMIAKEADSQRTQAIDLQWMGMACDPDSVSRETCDELPVIVSSRAAHPHPPDLSCAACPAAAAAVRGHVPHGPVWQGRPPGSARPRGGAGRAGAAGQDRTPGRAGQAGLPWAPGDLVCYVENNVHCRNL